MSRSFEEPLNAVTSLGWEGRIALLRFNSPPVNALSHAVREGWQQGMARALNGGAAAVIVICAGSTFFAGADITEFGKPFQVPSLLDLQQEMDMARVPLIAAIHGTALGGGLEMALACHYRVVADTAQLGLPEVHLGLLPGGGGTQRTPRLVGFQAAIDLIAGGKPVGADAALRLGLVDRIVPAVELEAASIAFAHELIDTGAPLRRTRDLPVDLTLDKAAVAANEYRARNKAAFKGFRAPANILAAILAATDRPFEDGIAREAELFAELMDSDESAAQRYAFFAERACGKIPGIGRDVARRQVQQVAVIGAGTMGTGIALAFLGAGFAVTLIDRSAEALGKAEQRIVKTITGLVEKGRISESAAAVQRTALALAGSTEAAAQADLVVEAVFEDMALKQRVFTELDGVVRQGAILATNTSYLDVDAIAAVTKRPYDVVGLHFFAPANIMRLLEVVRGKATAPDVLATALDIGRKLRKLAVVSGVCEGFIANRLMARRSEAADRQILEGTSPQDIDRVLVEYGFPMGHFQMMDLVGLDVIGWDRENTAGRTVQEILCEAGDWGQKTGAGYYDYRSGTPLPAQHAIEAIATIRAHRNAPQQSRDDESILFELLAPVVNEAAKLIEEDIVYRASDIDMALIAGYGWPVYRGGPLFWGDRIGLDRIARLLKDDGAVVSPLLAAKAAAGETLVPEA